MTAVVLMAACWSQVGSHQGPVTVAKLLKDVGSMAGVSLSAEDDMARVLVDAWFDDVSLGSFKEAIAHLLDAEWEGTTLRRTPGIARAYSAHLENLLGRNAEDLRQFVRFVKGEMRAEDVPKAFPDSLRELPMWVERDLASWTQSDVERALAGRKVVVLETDVVRYTVQYSKESGLLVFASHGDGDDKADGVWVGASVYALDGDGVGWQRQADWLPFGPYLSRLGGPAGRGTHTGEVLARISDKPAIAIHYPSVTRDSLAGSRVYCVRDGWMLCRPQTYWLPDMYSVDPVLTSEPRTTDPSQAISLFFRVRKERPYRYQDSWTDDPTWNELTAPFKLPLFGGLWEACTEAERAKLLRGRLFYQYINPRAQEVWLTFVTSFIQTVADEQSLQVPSNLTVAEVLAANVRLRAGHRVVYKLFGTRGMGMMSDLDSLRRYFDELRDETVLHVFDEFIIDATVALKDGTSFHRQDELTRYVGPATLGELNASPPEEHPAIALRNRQ